MIAVVVPRRQVAIVSASPGALADVKVTLGDRVESGQVVAHLDDRALASALDEARGALRAAKADERRASLEQQEAASRSRRRASLLRQGVVSVEEAEDARFAAARASQARDAAAAAIERAQASVAQLERDRDGAALAAPFAGRVAAIHQVAGARVAAGEPVVTIVSDDAIVRFAAPPARADAIAVGATVELRVGDARRKGHVVSVAPAIDPAAQMLFAECTLDGDAAWPPLHTTGRVAVAR